VISNFSWVISDKLAGSALPAEAYRSGTLYGRSELGSGHSVDITDLSDLYDRGIRFLVSLTRTAAGLGTYCKKANLDWHFYPIPDFGIPENEETFHRLIGTIIDTMKSSKPVCVHCYAGIGRTGLVLCCTVGRFLGLPAVRAISMVRRFRSALETRDQERFVQRYLEQYPQD
jgi:hypothetical protein